MAAADGDRWLRVPEAVRYHNVFCPSRHGPVAQLGARLNGIQEVTGSIPVRSTKFSNRRNVRAPAAGGSRRSAHEKFDAEGRLRHPERAEASMRLMLRRLVWWSLALQEARAARPYGEAA